jgi:hypothetical protein
MAAADGLAAESPGGVNVRLFRPPWTVDVQRSLFELEPYGMPLDGCDLGTVRQRTRGSGQYELLRPGFGDDPAKTQVSSTRLEPVAEPGQAMHAPEKAALARLFRENRGLGLNGRERFGPLVQVEREGHG